MFKKVYIVIMTVADEEQNKRGDAYIIQASSTDNLASMHFKAHFMNADCVNIFKDIKSAIKQKEIWLESIR